MAENALQVVEGQRVHHPSSMAEKPGALLRFLGRNFFDRVQYDPRHASTIHRISRQGSVVFVMSSQSLLDWLYFNWVLLKFGLPLVWFANGIRWFEALVARRLGAIVSFLFAWLFRRVRLPASEVAALRETVTADRAALLFLKKARALLQWGAVNKDELLEELIRVRRETGRPLWLVPQLLIWRQEPERYRRSLVDLFLGPQDAPGRIRKILAFALNYRRAFVQLGEPLELGAWLEEHAGDDDDTTVARRLGWALHRELAVEQKVVRGPVLKDARQIRSEILRNKEFQTELQRVATDSSLAPTQAAEEASKYLKEMAADFRMGYVEGFCLALTGLWRLLYAGGEQGIEVDYEGLERLREAGRRAPLILVPTHRSHIDYLVVSYLFFAHGLIPPHIAAGVNLSFWPMGHIFRHSGAFFIRRSFKDNPVYSMVFRYYLRKLVKEGYWIEFFVEGGRSRTGKLLPPRFGMLKELFDAVRDGVRNDLMFCPVSISYEKIIEEGSYTRELTGADKAAENVGSMIKASRALTSKYGRMYVQFAEPLSLRAFLDEKGVPDEEVLPRDREADLVKRLGYRIMDGMVAASIVSPSALVSTVLLSHLKRGISRSNLLVRIGWLIDFLGRRGAALSKTVRTAMAARRALLERPTDEGGSILARDMRRAQAIGAAVDDVIEETIGLFVRNHSIQVRNFGDELVYQVVPDRRINLDMSKANLLQLMARDAILALGVVSVRSQEPDGTVPVAKVRAECKFLSRLLKLELVYEEGVPFDRQFDQTVEGLVAAGLLELAPSGDAWTVPSDAVEMVTFLGRLVASYVESYWFTVQHLSTLAAGVPHAAGPTPEKEWLKGLHRVAERYYHEGVLTYREANSSVTFKNALDVMLQLGIARREERAGEGRRGRPLRVLHLGEGGLERIAELATRISKLRLGP